MQAFVKFNYLVIPFFIVLNFFPAGIFSMSESLNNQQVYGVHPCL